MMNARTTRTIAAAAAVACACAAAAVLVIRSPWRPRAIRIRSVRVVDAAGRPLSSLFSGMASSPQYDPRLIALARRPPSLCRQGWLDRALSYVETVVYAQSASGLCSGASCSCNGSGWVAGGGVNCPITSDGSCNSGATYNTAERDPAGQSALGNQSCGTGCGGAGCPINACNWTVCASPGNQDCTIGEPCPNGDSDCDPGYSCTSGCCAPTPPPPPKQVGLGYTERFMPGLLDGKLALVTGIANRWSLAYAIAQAFTREGATLVVSPISASGRGRHRGTGDGSERGADPSLRRHQGRRTGRR
jgi:hypothetical protein